MQIFVTHRSVKLVRKLDNPASTLQAATLAIGSELLDGRTHEANAHFICNRLSPLGVTFVVNVQCGDSHKSISDALDYLFHNAVRIIFITGGLGPTVDDKTRESIAAYAGQALVQDSIVVEQLHKWFERRGRTCAPSNELQAFKPAHAVWLENDCGTAPGFYLKLKKHGQEAMLVAMPGVPNEMRVMLEEKVLPILQQEYVLTSPNESVFLIFGLPESTVNDRVARLGLPESIEVIFSVAFPIITLILRVQEGQQADLERADALVSAAIDQRYVFSRTLGDSLEQVLVRQLVKDNKSVAVAESCTGGQLGALITAVPGASACFLGGVISYSNSMKSELLDVPEELLQAQGAVSEAVVAAMALGVRRRCVADYGLAISGIAGPEGGSEEKPVGTVCLALATPEGVESKTIYAPFDREKVRRIAAFAALAMLRHSVLSLVSDE